MLRYYILYYNISSSSSCCNHICTCFNLIWYNRISASMKSFSSLYSDYISTSTLYIASHTIKEVRNVNYMRLLCWIFNNCLSLCKNCCKHYVNCSTYRWTIKIYMISLKLFGTCFNNSRLDLDICAQRFKALNMLVYRS